MLERIPIQRCIEELREKESDAAYYIMKHVS
jgi:hypothetical protein